VRYLGASGLSLLWRTPVLLLETKGRRTGRTRRAAVAYWRADGAYFVGGGAGGMTRVDWVANLRASSHATVWVDRRRTEVTVTELRGDRYEQARHEAMRRWPRSRKYEHISGRAIPYFELAPVKPVAR
jgi:deazaflavin-dependent oxidoreductase (nitroreductase family)